MSLGHPVHTYWHLLVSMETYSYVCVREKYDSFKSMSVCERDMTHSYVSHTNRSSRPAERHTNERHTNERHTNVWLDSWLIDTCVTWLMSAHHTQVERFCSLSKLIKKDVKHMETHGLTMWHVRAFQFNCMTWILPLCDVTYSYARHDPWWNVGNFRTCAEF